MDFLLIEQMNHAGTMNGKLKATWKQLETFGLSTHSIARAIDECEHFGLVDVTRGGMRVANTYRLTFYPLHDGTPATNRWKDPKLHEKSELQANAKFRNLPAQMQADIPPKMQADVERDASDVRLSAPSSTCTNAGPSIFTATPTAESGDVLPAAKPLDQNR